MYPFVCVCSIYDTKIRQYNKLTKVLLDLQRKEETVVAFAIETPFIAVNAGFDYAPLVSKKPLYSVDANGNRTSDAPIGIRLTVALQGNRFEQLRVKFNTDPLPTVTDEAIETALQQLTPILIKLPDTQVKLYQGTGGLGMTGTGTTAQVVTIKN